MKTKIFLNKTTQILVTIIGLGLLIIILGNGFYRNKIDKIKQGKTKYLKTIAAPETHQIAPWNSDGLRDSEVIINNPLHKINTALALRIPLANKTVPGGQAGFEYGVVSKNRPDRENSVLATIFTIPTISWQMVSTSNKSEVFKPFTSKMFLIILFIILIMLVITAFALFIYRSRQKNIYKHLWHSQQKFKTILNSIGEGVIMTDENNRVKYINPVAQELTGWNSSQAMNKKLIDVFHIIDKETHEPIENRVDKIKEDELITKLLNRFILISRNGEEISIEENASIIKNDEKNIIGAVFVFRDITEKLNAKRALDESEQLFSKVFYDSPVPATLIKKDNLKYTEVSDAWCNFLGISREEAIGHTAEELEILTTESKVKLSQVYGSNKSLKNIELSVYTKTGQKKNILSSIKTIKIGGENYLINLMVDITERKDQGKKYKQLLDGMNDTIHVIDFEANHIEVNEAAVKNLGYSRKELLSMGPADIDPYLSEDKIKKLAKEMRTDKKQIFETKHKSKDGNITPVEINSNLIEYQGKPAILSVARDITARKKAEKELRKNKRLLDETERITKTGGWEYDVKKDRISWTDEVYRIHDVDQKEFNPNHVDQNINFYDESDQKIISKAFNDAINSAKPYDLELRFESAKGNKKWVRTSGRPIKEDGEVVRLIGHITDITERKEKELHIQRLNRRYALLSRINQAIIRTKDEKDLFKSTSKIVKKYGQFRMAWIALIDRNNDEFKNLASSGYVAGYLEVVKKTLEEKDSNHNLIESTLQDGKTKVCNNITEDLTLKTWRKEALKRNYHSTIVIPLKHDNQVIGVLNIYSAEKNFFDADEIDLLNNIGSNISYATVAIKTAGKLRKSERRYRTILENTGVATVIMEKDTTISFVNKQFEKLSGFSRDKLENKKSWTEFVVKNDLEKMKKYHKLRRKNDENVPNQYEFKFKNKDGQIKDIFLTVTIIPGTQKSVASLLDITEQNELREELRQAHKMESIGRLAGGVAHDMNNLLSPILGYSELLKHEFDEDSPNSNYAENIYKAGLSAKNLVNQLLTFSRKQKVKMKLVNINNILKNFKKLLRKTIRENININYKLREIVPRVQADKSQIEQVIMNLAVNAQDAMPKGGEITIETDCRKLNGHELNFHKNIDSGQYIIIKVSDTGCGMDKETQEKIFEPFFSTKGKKGTGMGLSTVFGIVNQHHGDIHVKSEVGQGTTFKIYLPVVQENNNTSKSNAEPNISTLKGDETILVTEDNLQTLNLVQRVLESKGYSVHTAENGQAMLSKVKNNNQSYDLLITDVVMPGMNGKELYQKLVKIHPHLKVIYMSGYPDNVISQHDINHKDINFIQKPFSINKFSSQVRKVLDK